MACSRHIPTSILRSSPAGRAAPSTPAPITFTASVLRQGPANNIFAVSNIEGLETFRLFELWFEQSLLQDKLKVRIGSLAADSEFFISDSAALFLNGTFGWPAVTAANMAAGGPGYPLASLGVRVQYAPTDNLTILAAVFNGSPADPFAEDPQADNRHGTEFRLEDAPLLMLEGQFKYNIGDLPGTLKLGGWKQLNHYAPEFPESCHPRD